VTSEGLVLVREGEYVKVGQVVGSEKTEGREATRANKERDSIFDVSKFENDL